MFGIRPWEWDLLTVRESEALMKAVDDYEKGQ